MYAKRFSLLAAMLLAFAAPSFANHFGTTTGTVTCSGYSLSFQVINETGTSHTISYSFILHPASGPNIPISGSTTFPTISQGATVTITVTGTIPALTQTYSVISGSATLTTDGTLESTASINFSTPTVGPCTFKGCSVTQGGWGAPPHGNNPGAFLASNFGSAFPTGVSIGGSPFAVHFTSATAVQNFLPQGGPPSSLNTSATNPITTSAGVFAGQVLALRLNVSLYNLGSLTLTGTGTSLDGSTVSTILADANVALGGGSLPSGFTFSSLNDLIDDLNSSFDGCMASSWATSHLR
jgi:hypothetical protein